MKKINFILFCITAIIANDLNAQQQGDPDSTFNSTGIAVTSIDQTYDYGLSVAIQPDQKIVVGGYSYNSTLPNNDISLVRYNSDGTLDAGFGSGGTMLSDFGMGDNGAISIAVQPNGQIVAGGFLKYSNQLYFSLSRYSAIGAIDLSFGNGGIVQTGFGTNDQINSIVIQPDGKIVAGGYAATTSYDFALARYNTNGSLDNTFGIGGKVITGAIDAVYNGDDRVNSIVLQPDGKIIAAGYADGKFAMTRYLTNGTLDTTFSSDGKIIIAIGSANCVMVQSDGKIVAAGYGNNDFIIARLLSDGSFDNTFGTNGIVTTSVGPGSDKASSVVQQQDGKLIVSGVSVNGAYSNFAIARYNTNGTLDTSFGNGGLTVTAIGGANSYAFSSALQSDGNIVVAGYTEGGYSDFAVVRYIAAFNIGVIDFSVPDKSVMVYPNPVRQNSTLEYILVKDETISIRLLDIQGKIIKSFVEKETQLAGRQKKEIIFPGDMANGAYSLVISSPEGSRSIRIVKQ